VSSPTNYVPINCAAYDYLTTGEFLVLQTESKLIEVRLDSLVRLRVLSEQRLFNEINFDL